MDHLTHFGRGGLKKKGEIGKKKAYLDFFEFFLFYYIKKIKNSIRRNSLIRVFT